MYDLQRFVKEHIEECANGDYDRWVQELKETDQKNYKGEPYIYVYKNGESILLYLDDLGICKVPPKAPVYDAPVKSYEKDCYYHQELNKKICPDDPEYGK